MIQDVTALLKGPIFIFSLTVAILGVLRLAFLHFHLITTAFYNSWKKTGGSSDFVKIILSKTGSFEFFKYKPRSLSFAWIAACAFFTFIFLFSIDHVTIFERHFGVRLIAVSRGITAIALAVSVVTIIVRMRLLSSAFKDTVGAANGMWFWTLLLVILVTGFFASTVSDPGMLPFMQFLHVACGDTLIMLIPFSRLGYWFVSPLATITCHLGILLSPDSPKGDGTAEYLHRLSEKR